MTQAILNSNGFATKAGTLTVYSYHPETAEYLGEINPFISLGTGIPANSTLTAPPQIQSQSSNEDGSFRPVSEAGFVYCWNDNAWQKTENHRGKTVYAEKDGSPFEIKQLGTLPEGYTEIKPAVLSAGEALAGFDQATQKWLVNAPSALFLAKANYEKYTNAYFSGLPIDNLPPDAIIEKAKTLAAWIKQAESNGEKE